MYQEQIFIKFTFPFAFLPSFFLPWFFRAMPTAYGSSQARGGIGATAAAYNLTTATWDPSRVCDPYHRSLLTQ